MVLHGTADSNAQTSDAGARTRGHESAHKGWQPAGTGQVQPSFRRAPLVPCSLLYQKPREPVARSPSLSDSFLSLFNHFQILRPIRPILACYTRIRGGTNAILNRLEAEANHNGPGQRLAVWRRVGSRAVGRMPAQTRAGSRGQRYRIETQSLYTKAPESSSSVPSV